MSDAAKQAAKYTAGSMGVLLIMAAFFFGGIYFSAELEHPLPFIIGCFLTIASGVFFAVWYIKS